MKAEQENKLGASSPIVESAAADLLPENDQERRQFNIQASRFGGPLQAIALTLRMWSNYNPSQGSLSQVQAIMHNEIQKALARPAAASIEGGGPLSMADVFNGMTLSRAEVAIRQLLELAEVLLPLVPKSKLDADQMQGVYAYRQNASEVGAHLKTALDKLATRLPELNEAAPLLVEDVAAPAGPRWVQMLVGQTEPPHNKIVDVAFTDPGEPNKMYRNKAWWTGEQWISAGRCAYQDMDYYTIHYWLDVPETQVVPEVDTLPIPAPLA